ncbi:hypothetical protein OFO16_22525 [Vibrio natriegens]|uniref:hypothetical protein n=1 Tax=Vibrio natriegens TaxID=691 RepID=UPI0021E90160|nr:hypothetical protein [Vibrio natriegens]UYI49149.1 hypothetical protein OFO16_22525 [Vibrio natriegens]
MKKIRSVYGAAVLTLILTACGSDSDGDSNESEDTSTSSTEVSGNVSAPGGEVALLEHQTILDRVLNDVFPPAYAGITGLQPVAGALVELITIDDDGNQVGEVISTTYTSITGDYTITVPEGVSLAGNLVVRITGDTDTDLRSQVVQESVDISPMSEFVLRKFIQSGSALNDLTTESVIKLRGQVEEFNLASRNDMSSMLAALENEVGEFVDKEIASISSTTSSAVDISGNYRLMDMALGLHDGDFGTYALDMFYSSVALTGNADGNVELELTDNEGAWGYVHGNDATNYYESVYYTELEEDETVAATFDSKNILTIEGEFEEEIDGDWAWRSPPQTIKFQKVNDSNVAFSLSTYNEARYAAIDTNGDGENDALDPSDHRGSDVGRGLLLLAEQPANMSSSDLIGDFGRVYFGSRFNNNGSVEVEAETNVLTFSGSSTVDVSSTIHQHISRYSGYSTEEFGAEPGLSIVTDGNGDIVSVVGEEADGFVNSDYNFLVFYNADGLHGSDMEIDTTLAVKLPSETPVLTGNTYRLIFTNAAMLSNTAFELAHSGFTTKLEFNSETSATLTGSIATIDLPSFGASLETTKESVSLTANSSVASNGAATITVADNDGTFTMAGYFNESASLGIFTTTSANTDSDPDGLGLAVLVEID